MRMLAPSRTRILAEHFSIVLSGKFGTVETVAIQAIRRFSYPTGQIQEPSVTVATKRLFYVLSNAIFAIYYNSTPCCQSYRS